MFTRLTRDVRAAVLSASRISAEVRGDSHLGTEHLLIGLLWERGPFGRLEAQSLRDELARMDREALQAIGLETDGFAVEAAGRPRHRPRFTAGARDCLHRSLKLAIARGDRKISDAHLIASLASSGERDMAVRLIRRLGIDPAEVQAEALTRLDQID